MNENIVSLLNSAQNILICVSKNAKLDSIASALALTLAISQQGKRSKSITR
jgi:nanoRNase/pAp phosphatase (c-di-AMP/oligoRNAs hydrolase)